MRVAVLTVAMLTVILLGGAGPAPAGDAGGAIVQIADQIASVLPVDGQVRIVVTDFGDRHGVTSDYGRYLADLLIIQLGRTPRFLPMERRHLRIVLGLFELKGSDLGHLDNARKVASQFHADMVLLDGLTDVGAQVALDTRVVDVATGKTLGFASAGVTKDAKVQRMLEAGRQ